MNLTERKLWHIILVSGILLALLAKFKLLNINSIKIPWKCPFKLLTGLPCPGCGMTKATKYLLEGHFKKAFLSNPLVFLFVNIVLILAILPEEKIAILEKAGLWKNLLIIVLVWWIVRIVLKI